MAQKAGSEQTGEGHLGNDSQPSLGKVRLKHWGMAESKPHVLQKGWLKPQPRRAHRESRAYVVRSPHSCYS